MKTLSFQTNVAAEVGTTAATVFHNVAYLCELNGANGRNVHDGKAWTYNSCEAYAQVFECLSAKQVRTALDKLETCGLIESGNFNKKGYDRTKWYTPTAKGWAMWGGKSLCQDGNSHLTKRANGVAQTGEPIPAVNQITKTAVAGCSASAVRSTDTQGQAVSGASVGQLIPEAVKTMQYQQQAAAQQQPAKRVEVKQNSKYGSVAYCPNPNHKGHPFEQVQKGQETATCRSCGTVYALAWPSTQADRKQALEATRAANAAMPETATCPQCGGKAKHGAGRMFECRQCDFSFPLNDGSAA